MQIPSLFTSPAGSQRETQLVRGCFLSPLLPSGGEREREREGGGDGAAFSAAGSSHAAGKLPGPVRGVPLDSHSGAGDDGVQLSQVPAAADAAAGADGRRRRASGRSPSAGHRSDEDPAPLCSVQSHTQCPARPISLQLPAVRGRPRCGPHQAPPVLLSGPRSLPPSAGDAPTGISRGGQ